MKAATNLDVVFFELRGLRCALPVSVVREVLAMPGLTPVPLAPPVLRGITPVRGQVFPVLDLGVYFQPASNAHSESAGTRPPSEKLLLVETLNDAMAPSVQAALVVEQTVRLGTVDEDHSRPPPSRPPFVLATILDATGPALLINAQQAIEHARSAISTVTSP